MKNYLKQMGLLLVALITLLSLVPKVGAAEVTVSELLGRSYESYMTLSTLHGHGRFSAAIDRQSQHMDLGEAEVDTYLDVNNLDVDVNLTIDSLFMPQFQHIRFGIKDRHSFFEIDDRDRSVVDISQDIEMLQESIVEEGTPLLASDILAQYDDLIQEIFEVKETDTEYILRLKENIAVRKLFDDYKTEVDAFKQAIYNEMEAWNEDVSDTTKQQIDRFYSAKTLEDFLDSRPVFEIHFSKSRHLVTAFKMEITLQFKDFLDVKEVEQLGLYTFYYSIDMIFDRFDKRQEIEIPEISQSSDTSEVSRSEASSGMNDSSSE